MIKVLDYYYLVLMRGFGKLYYRATGLMAFTFGINLFSLAILFYHHFLDEKVFWICFIVFGLVIYSILNVMYNKKRRERIREQYKNENDESRIRGVVIVILYEILSIAFLIWTVSISV